MLYKLKQLTIYFKTHKVMVIACIAALFVIGISLFIGVFPTLHSSPNRIYNLSPMVLRDRVEATLQRAPWNLKFISISEGKMETDYEEYPGEFHGILWWRKQWQERRKYYIEIQPVWGETTKSQLFIQGRTETRPNDNYPWEECECPNTDAHISLMLQFTDFQIRGGEDGNK